MKMVQPARLLITAALVFAAVLVASAQRRDVFVQSRLIPAINYDAAETNDPIARLNKRLADGSATLKFEPDNGYLTLRPRGSQHSGGIAGTGLLADKLRGETHQREEPARRVLQRHGRAGLGSRFGFSGGGG